MKVLSVNISSLKAIIYKGKEEQTGYFKTSVDEPVLVQFETLKGDSVEDRIHHGGKDKACYMYSYSYYDYWRKLYPNLDWSFGMFGENLTIQNLDETIIKIGDIFELGEAIVQVTQPRQPCYKLGLRFENQKMINQFKNTSFSGIYFRVLKEGFVKKNDELYLIESNPKAQTVAQVFQLIYSKNPSKIEIEKSMSDIFLAQNVKDYLLNKFQK